MIFSIISASIIAKVEADRVVDTNDNTNDTSLIPVGGVGNNI